MLHLRKEVTEFTYGRLRGINQLVRLMVVGPREFSLEKQVHATHVRRKHSVAIRP
jgi:hypothetical protein